MPHSNGIGHIAFVEKVLPDGTLILSEQNYDNNGGFRQSKYYPSQYLQGQNNYFV